VNLGQRDKQRYEANNDQDNTDVSEDHSSFRQAVAVLATQLDPAQGLPAENDGRDPSGKQPESDDPAD
jgi:hypothetical protein